MEVSFIIAHYHPMKLCQKISPIHQLKAASSYMPEELLAMTLPPWIVIGVLMSYDDGNTPNPDCIAYFRILSSTCGFRVQVCDGLAYTK
jgi:hypothetical protein